MSNIKAKAYTKAAELVIEPQPMSMGFKVFLCSCYAITRTGYKNSWSLRGEYAEVFKPKNKHELCLWFGPTTKRNSLTRSLALLFMAELTK